MSDKPKCQQIQPDEAAMLNNVEYTPEELFEAAYRAQAKSPVFIVDDALLKGADGEYFHLATRTAFKFFKAGRESWTN